MAIKASVIKRIEKAEKFSVSSKKSDMIWIDWDESCNKWRVWERYFSEGYREKSKVFHFNNFKDYVIPAEFEGTILINMMECPEPVDLFKLDTKETRKELDIGKNPFSIEYALDQDEEEQRMHKFNITIIDRV